MIKPVTYYVAVCDRCGKEHEGSDYSAWSDAGGALDDATSYDWVMGGLHDPEIADGRLLCPDCVEWDAAGDAVREKPPLEKERA